MTSRYVQLPVSRIPANYLSAFAYLFRAAVNGMLAGFPEEPRRGFAPLVQLERSKQASSRDVRQLGMYV
jgi:hypothetical protein